MPDPEFTVSTKRATLNITLQKMFLFRQCKIIEAHAQNNHVYYLFFYKNDYLTAFEAKSLRRNSFIEHALKEGIAFQLPDPLIKSFLPPVIKKHTHEQLFIYLKKNYSPHEVALISTFFESFIPRKKIFELIQEIYFQYHRDGNTFSSYRTLRTLLDFIPNHRWVKEFSKKTQYSKYKELYDNQSEELMKKDLLFAEKELFKHMEQEPSFLQLDRLLRSEERWVDLVIIHMNKLKAQPTINQYTTLMALIKNHFAEKDIYDYLQKLYLELPDLIELQQDLIDHYLEVNNPQPVVKLLQKHKLELTPSQMTSYEDIFYSLDYDFTSHIKELNMLITPLLSNNPQKVNSLLQKYVSHLLKEQNLLYVKKWLTPLKKRKQSLPIVDKIEQMCLLSNDPEQQLQLGEFYYEFNQMQKAIECFNWEIELNNSDPRPVRWLTRIYREKGMHHEFKAYQQHYIEMQKKG